MKLNNVQTHLDRAFREKLNILLSNGEVGSILSIHNDNDTYGALVKCSGKLRLLNSHGECQLEHLCSVVLRAVLEHEFDWDVIEPDIEHIRQFKSNMLYGRRSITGVWERLCINPTYFQHLPVDVVIRRPVTRTVPHPL